MKKDKKIKACAYICRALLHTCPNITGNPLGMYCKNNHTIMDQLFIHDVDVNVPDICPYKSIHESMEKAINKK